MAGRRGRRRGGRGARPAADGRDGAAGRLRRKVSALHPSAYRVCNISLGVTCWEAESFTRHKHWFEHKSSADVRLTLAPSN